MPDYIIMRSPYDRYSGCPTIMYLHNIMYKAHTKQVNNLNYMHAFNECIRACMSCIKNSRSIMGTILQYCNKTINPLHVQVYIPEVAADQNPLRSVIKLWYYRWQRCIYTNMIALIIYTLYCLLYGFIGYCTTSDEVVINV